ncbi:DUF4974 domain-containing protein [Chitinophaga agrisoli]|uniref:DUF4974 domain-containing protein n=1 Tax=Chitinophaga agrisoli TaxID=2607653 RepID=A0A5B2VWW6_9BACT|nr:FecR domain-containing protein [Chitinophaga agrisoli]KAA2243585.1 DUF4974 domain-containing protein [Chitinophaga agrisoli]
METGKIKQLLKRYLLGQVAAQETRAIDDWYASFDAAVPAELPAQEERQLHAEIWRMIQPEIRVTRVFYRRPWVRAAAAVLMLLGAGMAYFLLRGPQAREYTAYHTANGERRTIRLQDGTSLTLNAGSTLLLSKDWDRERRLQLVDGEVFFEVAPDTRRPFVVESGPLTTTVLGTAFNISAYTGIHKLSVAVVAGKVSVAGKTGASLLEKGRELVYDKQDGHTSIQTLATDQIAWTQGKLLLNDVSFEEMSVLVEKNFGIKIITTQAPVTKNRYTTELQLDMPPAAAIEVLAAIHQLKIKRNGNQVLLYE